MCVRAKLGKHDDGVEEQRMVNYGASYAIARGYVVVREAPEL